MIPPRSTEPSGTADRAMRQKRFLGRNPLFRRFIAAGTVSFLGSNIFDIAMPIYVWNRTQSAIAMSLVTVAMHLPYLLASPITGYIADTYDKRRVMLVSDLGQVVTLTFLLIYLLSGTEALWPILTAVFLVKAWTITFETVTSFQLIPALVSSRDLASANTWFLSSLRLIQVIGPITGGVLMTFLGIHACIVANIASFGATLYLSYSIREMDDGQARRPATHRRRGVVDGMSLNFWESLRYVVSRPLLLQFVGAMFLWNLSSLLPNTPTMVYYFMVTKGLSPAQYGLAVSLFGVFGILGYVIASYAYERLDFRTALVGACLWQAVLGTLCLFLAWHPLATALVFGASRMGSSVLNMGTYLIRQTRVPRHLAGGVNASLRMLFMTAAPVSSALQGLLLQHVSVWVSMVLGAVCLWGVLWRSKAVAACFEEIPVAEAAEKPRAA